MNILTRFFTIAIYLGSFSMAANEFPSLKERATLVLAQNMTVDELKATMASLSIEQAESFLATLLLYADLTPPTQAELIATMLERNELTQSDITAYEDISRLLLSGQTRGLILAF